MNAPAEKIAADIRVLMADVEALLKATASQTSENIAAARARIETSLAEARLAATAGTDQATHAAKRLIRENPLRCLGVAAGASAGIGLLIGLLLGRR
jgi:ElaB/YqjD/DUF883 family membrane-anchored ribosome-binding protein